MCTLWNAPHCDLMLFEGDDLVTRACTSNSGIRVGDVATRGVAKLAWQAIDDGKPVVIDDYSSWPNRRSDLADVPFKSVAAFPIMQQGRCLGVFMLGRLAADQPFTGQELAQCHMLSETLVLVLADARQSEELASTAGLLERTSLISRVGGWELNLSTLQSIWSDETFRIYELPPPVAPATEAALGFFAPDAQPVARAAAETCIDHGTPWDLELPLVTAKGRRLWVRYQGQAEMRDGKAVRLFGIVQDITERKTAEQALIASEARLSSILDTAMVGIITVNEEFKVTVFNAEAEAILGYRASEILGQPIDRLIPLPNRADHGHKMRAFAEGERSRQKMSNWRKVNGLHRSGTLVPLMAGISKVRVGDSLSMTVIFRDMSEVLEAEAGLRKLAEEREIQLKKAETANRAKSQFLATMSHELRTPLNAIIGFASLIENETLGPVGNEKYREYIHDVHESGRHLLSLINDILDLSRIEASRYDFEIVPVDTTVAMREAATLMEAIAAQKAISLEIQEGSSGSMVLGDRRAIHQILTNLIGNAIKFTHKGGKVRVEVQRDGGWLALVVSDNGRGIPADRIADFGQPFVQVQGAHSRDQGGSGLGLAICKGLARGMDGNIKIDSEMGKGTRVHLILPVAANSTN
ncbi:ATP-binding protein [Dongia sp.]|uniref:PAS domain-containing sensor histidine kinase n=1 Tax=Dongia sp. TaxID=1977262 RepID=UPI0035B04CE1